MRSFRSDNTAGICPEALDAITRVNQGHHIAYGDDEITRDAVAAFRDLFGAETSVWFVATGTAANTLSIASLTRPWQQVICHRHSHYNDDESTAPERLSGCRMVPVRTEATRLTPESILSAGGLTRGDVHQPQPGVVVLSNTTEFGTVYRPEEVRAICDAAHEHGYRVHVDGTRIANATAALGCDVRELTVAAGVDAMSFGGAKNGLACGEAVLFFPQGDGCVFEDATSAFPYHHKATGHLLSKQRFVTAPFASVIRTGAWLRHARHANGQARALSDGMSALGYEVRYPTEANAVFIVFSDRVDRWMRSRAHQYYAYDDEPENAPSRVHRLMCSFDTQPEDVDRLLADAAAAPRVQADKA